MTIFDDVARDYHNPATHNENEFSFLNRSARPAASRVRSLIETWASHLPGDDLARLRARLRSEFDSTFFELFLHELLRSLGCSAVPHPNIGTGRATRPDFLARFPSGDEVVMEAVLATDRSRDEEAHRARLGALYDEINKIYSPNFFLRIERVSEISMRQPSGRKLRAFIEECISPLDPDAIGCLLQEYGFDSVPTWTFRDGDFEFEFSVVPKAPEARGKPGSKLIGIYPMETRWGGSAGALKSALARKATKYGPLGCPYIIAVNAISRWGSDRIEEMEALFGSESFFESLASDELHMVRERDGLWIGPQGVRNTRVSAVLFTQVTPWSLPRAPICLYHNPFAEYPCVNLPWKIPHAVPSGSKMSWNDGATVGDLLGLNPRWPGELFDG